MTYVKDIIELYIQ